MNKIQQFKAEPQYKQICDWSEKFIKADRIKKLAYQNYFLWDKLNIDMDKRMNNVWESVIKIEPVKTFENGILTAEASGLLNMYKLSKAFK